METIFKLSHLNPPIGAQSINVHYLYWMRISSVCLQTSDCPHCQIADEQKGDDFAARLTLHLTLCSGMSAKIND
jgi:hypothetical protein